MPVNFGKTAVHEAAYAGAAQNLTALLEAGGDPHVRDQDGNTPLHLASMGSLIGRYPAAIRALLTRRADLHRTNDAGETPLHVAVFNGVGSAGPAVVKTLLDAGAKPKTVDGNGLTALQRFARHGEDMGGIVTLLIRAGADPNQKDPRGDAPLHAAIKGGGSHGKAEIVEALLAGGADPCVQDAGGSTPYQMSSGMQRIHRALARAGGDDASHAGDSGCKWLFDDAPQKADRNKGNEGEERSSVESAKARRSSSWPSAVADLEQQMVTVSGNVQLGKYLVTQALWEAVMGTNPSHFQGCGQCPVEQVSWDDVQVFMQKLNALTGEQYRLPTTAEWNAALGSVGGRWYWKRSGSGNRTHPVGQKAPNGLGLYDMIGNVLQWMEDCSEGDCSRRVLRGGSWLIIPEYLRSAGRSRSGTGFRDVYDGFRLARTLTP